MPAPHGSHAVRAALATLPASLQRVHASPTELTVPTGHALQLLAVEACVEQSLFALVHCSPASHSNGATQAVASEEAMVGATHSWHKPNAEAVPVFLP